MKKQMILFALLAFVATSAFAGLNPIVKNAKAVTEKPANPEEKGKDEEALHCVVFNEETGKKAAECWFCNCNELYDSVNGGSTTEQNNP